MDLLVGDLRLLTAKEHPLHLLVLECAQIIHTYTMSCIPYFTVWCTCLVLRHDLERRRVHFHPKWLSGSILGRLGQNFERLSKKIRSLGCHISLKIYEPGGTKLKYLLYKKIFVVKN